MTKTNQLHPGRIIAAQLGVALRLLGAKDLLLTEDGEGGLDFRVGKNPKRVTHISVTLTASDTYDLRFVRYSPSKRTTLTLATYDGIYADMMKDLIADETGLYTSF